MVKDYFHLAARIAAESKYFDISQAEIERQLEHSGKFKFEGELPLEDDGEEVTIPLHLHIASTNGPEAWSVAITLHSVRIDCIDRESKYRDVEGNDQTGWHRHLWDAASKSCEDHKVLVQDLGDEISLHDFLVRCFGLMRILLNRDDHGNYELRFSEDLPD